MRHPTSTPALSCRSGKCPFVSLLVVRYAPIEAVGRSRGGVTDVRVGVCVGQILLGYKPVASPHIITNPRNKMEPRVWMDGDKIVVMVDAGLVDMGSPQHFK